MVVGRDEIRSSLLVASMCRVQHLDRADMLRWRRSYVMLRIRCVK